MDNGQQSLSVKVIHRMTHPIKVNLPILINQRADLHLHFTVFYCVYINPSFLGWRVPKVVPGIWQSPGSWEAEPAPFSLYSPVPLSAPGIPVASGTFSWMLLSRGSDTSVYTVAFLFYCTGRYSWYANYRTLPPCWNIELIIF